MATFVQIEPDAFNKVFTDVTTERGVSDINERGGLVNSRAGQYHHVRRPVRGIQIKDETFATIQVRTSNGVAIPLFDAAADGNNGTGFKNSNFLLQSVAEQRAEKHQIILTFGEPYVFFFGEQPRIITVSGVLLNTEDFNWRAEWWENYENLLRGTQCVRMKTRVYLSWDDIIVEGYILSANAVEDASNNNIVQFSFQMFLTNYQNISNIGDPEAHFQGKIINLNPSDIDLPGQGGLSSTSNVRDANLQQQIQSAQNSGSLFEFLRNGPLSRTAVSLATTAINLPGQKLDFLSLAGRFISGRNIRVPIGFTGAAAFDQEVQLALSSIPGSLDVLNGTSSGRVISFQTSITGLVSEFRATLENKFVKANVGRPLSENTDEFVGRVQEDPAGSKKFNNLFNEQLADEDKAMERVAETFKRFGIEPERYNLVSGLVKQAIFGIVSVKNAGLLNTVGTLL